MRRPYRIGSRITLSDSPAGPLVRLAADPDVVRTILLRAHGRAPLQIIYISIGYIEGKLELPGKGSQAGAWEPDKNRDGIE